MKVKISELKAKLSAFLAAVRRGETVVVLDRKTPIAQLSPLPTDRAGFEVVAAARPPGAIAKVSGVKLKRAADVMRILASTRGDR